MLRPLIVLGGILLSTAAMAGNITLEKDGWRVISNDKGTDLLHQCSRHSPLKAGDFWQPTADDIALLESALLVGKRIAPHNGNATLDSIPDGSYRRQYIGYVDGGKKLIFGNFYPSRNPSKDDALPVIVCDGGPQFWGIEYDFQRKMIVRIDGNGAV